MRPSRLLPVACVFLFACPQGGAPGGEPAKTTGVEKKAEAPATPTKVEAPTKARAVAPALAKGERRKLDQQLDEGKRRAFWAAIQQGRKQTAGKDYAAAVASFDAALKEIPGHPRALSGRGYARLLAGELDAAEKDLSEALAQPGDPKIESAIAFNLGLVAEKRGDAEAARRHFTVAQTLRPSPAVAAKLAEGPACPARVDHSQESQLYASFLEIWQAFVAQGVVDPEAQVKDESRARAMICDSVDFRAENRPNYDACAGAKDGPWLVSHSAELWGHHLIERADGGQWRVTAVGDGGISRCGQRDTLTLTLGDVVHVRRETGYGIVVEVMEGKDGDIVECEGDGPCMTACGEDEVEVVDYLFSLKNPRPVVVSRGLEDQVEVVVNGWDVRLKGGGCDMAVPLTPPG